MERKVDLQQTIEDAFLRYAGHVIQDRSIPDVRDGLKLGARQLLYAQYSKGITHDKPFKKGIKSVSAGMEQSYVHGDASAYGTLIRMGKPFALRYPLQEVQGNFGTPIRVDNHASSRYIEMRMNSLANLLFEGINKNTIAKWKMNYDNTEQIPTVLPSPFFYNIVNGASGIAVGMSTSIPQFNLREVNDALVTLIKNPDAPFEQVYCQIDFATGATVINENEVRESLRVGQGKSAAVRATIEYDARKHQLRVTELPYSVYTETICGQLASILDENPACGIDSFLDATTDVPLIEINLSKSADPERMKNFLYKETSLQSYYSINMVMLEGGKTPKLFGWREALLSHLTHVKEVKMRELEYDLAKTKSRLHIVEGLLIAIEHIDAFIKIIRSSDSTQQAANTMIREYGVTDVQAKAILDIRLARLVSLEYLKVEKEKQSLIDEIKHFEKIIETPHIFNDMLIDNIREISKKYGDDRRTTCINIAKTIREDEVQIKEAVDKSLVVTVTRHGLLISADAVKFQQKNKTKTKTNLKSGDHIVNLITCTTKDRLLLVTNKGNSFTINPGTLIEDSTTYLSSLFTLATGEYIILAHCVEASRIATRNTHAIVFVTKDGMIKASVAEDLLSQKKTGLPSIKFKVTDNEVVCARVVSNKTDEVLVLSNSGHAVRFPVSEINVTGRLTSGVIAMKLKDSDYIVGAALIDKEDKRRLLTVTTHGILKSLELTELPSTSRYVKGISVQKLNDSDGIQAMGVVEADKPFGLVSALSMINYNGTEVKPSLRNAIGAVTIKNNGVQILYITEVL